MGNRVIREGWLESKRIASLDAYEERFFLRLCLKADDTGRFTGEIELLKSYLFPRNPNLSTRSIKAWLACCIDAELVKPYEVNGKHYLYIPRFKQRLRIKRSRYPAPPWKTDEDNPDQQILLEEDPLLTEPVPHGEHSTEKPFHKRRKPRGDPAIKDAARVAYARSQLLKEIEAVKKDMEGSRLAHSQYLQNVADLEAAIQANESSEWIARIESKVQSTKQGYEIYEHLQERLSALNQKLSTL